jgi:polyphosphate kinase
VDAAGSVSRRTRGIDRASNAVFRTLRSRDVLVHHPYESFETSVGRVLTAAAQDPAVRVVMSTLYRTGGSESSIVQALQGAAARGKQIVALVELKARFDEAHNLERARARSNARAHTSCTACSASRRTRSSRSSCARKRDGCSRYCHVARATTTRHRRAVRGHRAAHEPRGRDARRRRAVPASHERAAVRATTRSCWLRPKACARDCSSGSRRGRGRAADRRKVNGLSDPAIIDALYAASTAGAEIDLIVRGICCLRPGVAGLSERIRCDRC